MLSHICFPLSLEDLRSPEATFMDQQGSVNILGRDTELRGFHFVKRGHFLKNLVTIYCLYDFINENILAPKQRKDVTSPYGAVFDTELRGKPFSRIVDLPSAFKN